MKIGNIEAYGIVYKITNKVNKKVYIGITTKNNKLKDRYSAKGEIISEKIYKTHLREKENNRFYNSHLLRAMQKYGYENFEVIEVFDIAFSLEELRVKEKSWISIYQSNNPNYGYNKTNGGEGTMGYSFWYEKNEEELKIIREKYSKTRMGKSNPMYGKNHTKETREKISKTRMEKGIGKGENSYLYGKNRKGKYNPRAKSVICLTTKRIFFTAKEGGEYYNIARQNISKCCKGDYKTAGKYKNIPLKWKYLVWKHNKKYRMH